MQGYHGKLKTALAKGMAIIVFAMAICGIAPAYAVTTSVSQQPASELPSVEAVQTALEDRLESLKDIRAIVSVRQYEPNTQALNHEVQLEIQAVAPSIARLTINRPELYRGAVYVLDHAADEVYEYSPVLDLAQCKRIDHFIESSPLGLSVPNIDDFFTLPNGENIGDIEVTGTEVLDGREYVVLRAKASDEIEQAIEDGLDEVGDTLQSAGLSIDVGASDTLYVWVDLEQQFIRQLKVFSADEELLIAVEATDLRMDQGLTATALKSFRGADIRRCR